MGDTEAERSMVESLSRERAEVVGRDVLGG